MGAETIDIIMLGPQTHLILLCCPRHTCASIEARRTPDIVIPVATHAFDIAMRLARTNTIDIVMPGATDTLDITLSGAMQTLNVRLRVAGSAIDMATLGARSTVEIAMLDATHEVYIELRVATHT